MNQCYTNSQTPGPNKIDQSMIYKDSFFFTLFFLNTIQTIYDGYYYYFFASYISESAEQTQTFLKVIWQAWQEKDGCSTMATFFNKRSTCARTRFLDGNPSSRHTVCRCVPQNDHLSLIESLISVCVSNWTHLLMVNEFSWAHWDYMFLFWHFSGITEVMVIKQALRLSFEFNLYYIKKKLRYFTFFFFKW